ncbi:sigma-70 family RNA polymerase sigma factor [Desulfogranum marinum]|uniref:sigma-70 family RNA polymerase sigma factor n=1 Tax=Desulfogranum marinum TaxID=453220 RepID=UPI001964A43A|nr:sigma-70 family RNA polymerase sigma factor [Desulfogranum marinum]MBM9514866.1 sigma-70 family RNA polymerase sigma factor [Desulfogranum marinum]
MQTEQLEIRVQISAKCTDTWSLASLWIKSNPMLIKCIAAQYIPHMGCSSQDLESEALLVAYQTISSLFQSEKDLSCMARYFRVVFRSRCIQMTMGIKVVDDLDPEIINVPNEDETLPQELDQDVIDAALASLTNRQRQVAKWILSQPSPVNTDLVGEHFGISTRGVRRLINDAVTRIENGHRNVCRTIPALT